MNTIILKDAWPYALILLTLFIILSLFNVYSAIPVGFLLLFVLFFFRNPTREIEANPQHILSPADGRVLTISKPYEDDVLQCSVIKVSIFLSVFNVHVNRAPIQGSIFYYNHRPGKFLPAFKSHASEDNERTTIGIVQGDYKLLVRQITGFVARRIVCHVDIGDIVEQGQRYGLIKFGSCTEVIVPATTFTALVHKGDIVRGGKTVIGVVLDEDT